MAADRLGAVYERDGGFRAEVQHRDGEGKNAHISGPRRAEKRRADADLDSMRAAACNKAARGEMYEAMAGEGRALRERAAFSGRQRRRRRLHAQSGRGAWQRCRHQ